MPNPPKRTRQQARLDPQRSAPPEMIDLVDPRWVLKALAGLLAIALVCAYVTLCGVFAHTQWRLFLHPSRTVSATPGNVGLPFTEVRFGVDATGQPQLFGWWIPAQNSSSPTVVFLHSGEGSLANALPAARTLHDARLNVLLFDYRGYGRSGGQHPTEALMQADAESALRYLTEARSPPPHPIPVYGAGVGGSLAVRLCAEHSAIPALILDTPDGDFASRAVREVHSRLFPVSLLFNQTFPVADPLHTLATPKLLISRTTGPAPVEFERAADPKTTLELPTGDTTALIAGLDRFLGAYVQRPPPELTPASR